MFLKSIFKIWDSKLQFFYMDFKLYYILYKN